MPKNHLKPWRPVDLRVLRQAAAAKKSARQAARELRRTPGATKYKAMVEGVRFHAIEQPRGVQIRLARRRRRFGMRATLKAVRR